MRRIRPQEIKIEKFKDTSFKRVIAELIDFDWIFKSGNAKTMISILANQDNPKLYITKSV